MLLKYVMFYIIFISYLFFFQGEQKVKSFCLNMNHQQQAGNTCVGFMGNFIGHHIRIFLTLDYSFYRIWPHYVYKNKHCG